MSYYDDYDERNPIDKIDDEAHSIANEGLGYGEDALRHHMRNKNNGSNHNGGNDHNSSNNHEPQNNGSAKNNVSNGKSSQKTPGNFGGTVKNADEAGKAAKAGKEAAETADKAKKAADAGKAAAEAGKVAASTAAAAGTAGASLIAQAAVEATIGAVKAGKGMAGALLEGKEEGSAGLVGGIFKVIFIGLLIFFLFLFAICFYVASNSSSQNENNTEIQYKNADIHPNETSDRNDIYTNENKNEIEKVWDADQPFVLSSQEYVDKTDEAMEKAFTEAAINILNSLDVSVSQWPKRLISFLKRTKESHHMWTYNAKKTKRTFFENPYPYCRNITKNSYYKIGDYLKTVGFRGSCFDPNDYKTIPEANLNNDLNYAEFIAVVSQGAAYQTRGGTHKEYIDMFDKGENQVVCFEMTVEDLDKEQPIFYSADLYYDGYYDENGNYVEGDYIRTDESKDPNDPKFDNPPEGTHYKNFSYFLKIVVKPFGLREMYYIAGLEDDLVEDGIQPGNQITYNHPGDKGGTPGIKNYEMLDITERYDRIFVRTEDLKHAGYDGQENILGPSCLEERNKLSRLYNLKKAYFGSKLSTIDGNPLKTGRSANYYIERKYIINTDDLRKLTDPDWGDEGDIGIPDPDPVEYPDLPEVDDDFVRDFLNEARKYIGYPYVYGSKGPNSFDCSGLVSYCLQQISDRWITNIGGSSPVQYNNTQTVDKNNVQPGDLLFRRGMRKEGYVDICHVMIYIGDGRVIEAKGEKWGVVVSNVNWDKVYCGGRIPHTHR